VVPSPHDARRRLRVLVVTKLFPNAAEPMLATYNRLQCVALSRICDVEVRAVIPWFPAAGLFARWSSAGRCVRIPPEELVEGLRVRHPRVPFVPKVGAPISPALYLASLWPGVRHLRGEVDVVLGCWAFPDGVAAIGLARLLGAAAVVKAHGSDLNVLPETGSLRRIMSWSLPAADRFVAVSRPLAEKAVALGVPRDRVEVVRNGIDRDVFRLRDRAAERAALGLEPGGRWILYVGLLARHKGLADLLEAFDRLAPEDPELRLALVGNGPHAALAAEAAARHPGRVVTTGALPAEQVARWISACDVLTLPSWNEGTPNVILEAFACGRRVVATRVGGIPDVVTSPVLGELVPPRDVAALAAALGRAARHVHDPEPLVASAPHGWAESAAHLSAVLSAACERRRHARGAPRA
jgi:teichuronic acid biosynthesis glycosyltransferase TuaC